MNPGRFVLVSAGNRRLAFPVESVKAVREWEEPLALPGSKAWLKGILQGDGEVIPVLDASFWGNTDDEGRILLLAELHGRVLAIAGRDPGMISANPPPEGESGVWEDLFDGTIEESGRTADCVRVDKLYSALGLRYNNTDRIGGVDAEKDSFSR